MRRLLFLLLSTTTLTACLVMGEKPLTSEARSAISDSVRSILNEMNGAVVAKNAQSYYSYLSTASDARRFDNGASYPSVDSLTKAFAGMLDLVDSVRSRITESQVAVLSRNAASAALTIAFTAYPKNGASVEGKGAITALFQHEDGAWKITQFHESEENYAALGAALTARRGR